MSDRRRAAKPCTRCRRLLPLAAFHRKASARDGRQSQCRECRNAPRRKPGGRGPWPPLAGPGEPRECTGCRRLLPAAAFAPRTGARATRNGREARCRACTSARRAARAARRAEAATLAGAA